MLDSSVMIFAAVAVCLFMADKGTITHLPIKRVVYKITRWLEYITEGTETLRQAIDRTAIEVKRFMMVSELKTYLLRYLITDYVLGSSGWASFFL